MSQWLIKWADKLEKDSGGRIVLKRFPAAQMGPVQQHYDFARTGQADISWFLHGATPGRFPLTGIVQVPYLVGSAEIGTKVLNDPELRAKYLDPEHKGVKVLMLFTHQPGNIHTTKKPIKTVDDVKGMRLRFASPEIRDFVAALGGSPVGVAPTEQVEQMQKGTLDGVVIDYGGAGIAFKMGGTVKHSTEMYSYVASFGLAMNEDTWNKLPPDLQQLIAKSLVGCGKGNRTGLGFARRARQEGTARRRRRGDQAVAGRRCQVPQDRCRRRGRQGQGTGRQGTAGERGLQSDEGAGRQAFQGLPGISGPTKKQDRGRRTLRPPAGLESGADVKRWANLRR